MRALLQGSLEEIPNSSAQQTQPCGDIFGLLESIDLLLGENISTCQQDQQAYLGLGAEDSQNFI